MDQRSLVLIGNPRSNRVTALFESALPVRFEPSALTFRGKGDLRCESRPDPAPPDAWS